MFNQIANCTIDNLSDAAKKIANHYTLYVNNPFLKKTTSLIEISQNNWDIINDFIRMMNANLLYDLTFFYKLELSFAAYCNNAYYKVAPNINFTVSPKNQARELGLAPDDYSVYQILIGSFKKNIMQLAKYTSDLYQITVDLDTNKSAAHLNRKAIYTTISDIAQIDLFLLPILSEL